MGKVERKIRLKSICAKMWRYGAFAALVLLALPAFSQSCALCYTQAASSGARMIAALKSGILVLVIPPTIGSIGMIFVVHRRTNQVRLSEFDDDPRHDW